MNPELLRAIAQGGAGVIALGIVIILAGAREKPLWVFGREFRRLEEEVIALRAERDTERELNLRLLGVTEKAIAKQPMRKVAVPR